MSIAMTAFEIDQLRADLKTATYLLAEVTAERDALRRKLDQIGELKIDVEDGECNYCHAMLPGCRYSTWKANNE